MKAPVTMKSLLTSAWLLTVAFGNLIIIIIEETAGTDGDPVRVFTLFYSGDRGLVRTGVKSKTSHRAGSDRIMASASENTKLFLRPPEMRFYYPLEGSGFFHGG